jgi:hypothetical protein
MSTPPAIWRRQTPIDSDPEKKRKKREELKELRVLGGNGMARLRSKLKEARRGPLGARAVPPSGKKEWEPGASTGEAEVCKLNPAPTGAFIKR